MSASERFYASGSPAMTTPEAALLWGKIWLRGPTRLRDAGRESRGPSRSQGQVRAPALTLAPVRTADGLLHGKGEAHERPLHREVVTGSPGTGKSPEYVSHPLPLDTADEET